MTDNPSERRLAENQVLFRKHNEKVQKGFDRLNDIAKEAGEQQSYGVNGDMPLSFLCECSDESCRQRVNVSINDYNKIHEDNKSFVIICGHEVVAVETVVAKEPGYCVVRKYKEPPKSTSKLNYTTLDN